MNKIFEKEVDCSSEYILSDYMGDVKRVLLSRARVIPASRFINDTEAEFSGSVEFEIFYSDVDGRLTSVRASADYELSQPIEEGVADAMCEARVSNFSVRLTGPRRFALKSTVIADVYTSRPEPTLPTGSIFEEGRAPEKISKTLRAESALYAIGETHEYTDEIMLVEGAESDGLEILFTSGSVKVSESIAKDGEVLVRGEITVTAIVRNDTTPPFAVRKVIPFEERISVDGVSEGESATATAYIISAAAAVKELEDRCAIAVSASLQASAVIASNSPFEVITDAYLVDCEVKANYEDMPYSELICAGVSCESVNVEVLREGDLENLRDVVAAMAEVKSVERSLKDNGFEVSGELSLVCVGMELSDDGIPTYVQIKNTAPFAINVNTEVGVSDYMRLECVVASPECEAYIDSDRISARCPLTVNYRIYKDSKVRRLSHTEIIGEPTEERRRSQITVYYPKREDTLFDVARRFHTTSERIALDNSLSAECLSSPDANGSLSGVRRLIIKSV